MADPRPDLRLRPGFIIFASVLVFLMVLGLFGLTSLNLPFIRPSDSGQVLLLFALSTLIFLSLVIFGFILFRSLLKLHLERRAKLLGSHFKTKMVLGAIGLSVLPVFFLFLFSYSLINRTLDKWFSRPFEAVSSDAQQVVSGLDEIARNKVSDDAARLSRDLADFSGQDALSASDLLIALQQLPVQTSIGYWAVLDREGTILADRRLEESFPSLSLLYGPDELGSLVRSATPRESGLAEWEDATYALGSAPIDFGAGQSGRVVVGMRLPTNLALSAARLDRESILYGELSRERRFVRQTYISILLLLTVLILFIATWFALFLSRQVTVPIQALAEATQEISRGNLAFRVRIKASDELGTLVTSFNEMTEQLATGRAERDGARQRLEKMNLQLDQRRRFTETILESIPTGVISVSSQGTVLGSNTAGWKMFGRDLSEGDDLAELFSTEDFRELTHLMKSAGRLGHASRNLEIRLHNRTLQLAITVSALTGEPPGAEPAAAGMGWFVVVFEDLSDLLQAQKAAAWGEVAQRVAHEIKNPLTPIALSAERIRWWLDRHENDGSVSPKLLHVVEESCTLINDEVGNLKHLVDEFSQFARFPQARPVPSDLNQIVESALGAINGRLDPIRIATQLAPDLPPVLVDADLFRRVVVNLMDNAAEAMESSQVKELMISTRVAPGRGVVETEISDTGCGVTPEEKERLFSPFFSTKQRGTGLGLAIVSRIIAEHNGSIRVEQNNPLGTRFIVELPTVAA